MPFLELRRRLLGRRRSGLPSLTGSSSVAAPPASPDALTLSCASPNAGSDAELQWELTVGGGGAPYTYTIDFGDGTAASAGTWPASGVHRGAHGYGRPGDFQFTAQVRELERARAMFDTGGERVP